MREHEADRRGRAARAGLAALALGLGCAPPPPSVPPSPSVDDTDEGAEGPVPREEAMALGLASLDRVARLMAWPRALGAPQRDLSVDALERMLVEAGAEQVERQPFTADDPLTGERYALVNLVGHLRPEAPRRLVLATHFDTRPWADEEDDPEAHLQPVPGANDGTSGVAVLLEVLPRLAERLPQQVGVTVILFDGEELGHPGQRDGYCMGSRYFAAQAVASPPAWLHRAEGGIVLDMVGDRDLHLPIEPTSALMAPALVDRLWAVARRRGHAQFEPRYRPIGVLDDHKFLTDAGVPSILLIDKDYAPWHTRGDTLDQLSAESLGAVADTVLHTVLELAAEPRP